MKKKKKKSIKIKLKRPQKRTTKKNRINSKRIKNKKTKRRKYKKIGKRVKTKSKIKYKKIIKIKKFDKTNKKTRALVSSLLKLNDKIKSLVRFNFNIDRSLQNFFVGVSKKISGVKKIILEEREKQKKLKLRLMEPVSYTHLTLPTILLV